MQLSRLTGQSSSFFARWDVLEPLIDRRIVTASDGLDCDVGHLFRSDKTARRVTFELRHPLLHCKTLTVRTERSVRANRPLRRCGNRIVSRPFPAAHGARA